MMVKMMVKRMVVMMRMGMVVIKFKIHIWRLY